MQVRHPRRPPGRLRGLEHQGSLLPGVTPMQPSQGRLQHKPDPSTKSKDCLPPYNDGQKPGAEAGPCPLRRQASRLHFPRCCCGLLTSGPLPGVLRGRQPLPAAPPPRGQHPHLPPGSWSPRLPTASATLSQSLTPAASSRVTAAVTRPQLSSYPHTHPLTPATAPQPPGTPSSDPAPFHSPSPSHTPTSLLPAETPCSLL